MGRRRAGSTRKFLASRSTRWRAGVAFAPCARDATRQGIETRRARKARSTAPRVRITWPRGGRGVAELKWAIRRLAERDGRSRSQCCESALDAFTLAVQCGGCGVSVVRQWPRARFRRAALASAAVRPHGQGVSIPGPACNATRHGSTSLNTGDFPGCRVATRVRAAAASPFGLIEPASGSEWPVVPVAGRLPARHRDERDSGTGLRLAAPTSASADNAASGSLWMAAPYHRVTKASRAIFLAIPLPPLAARPLVPPVTTPFAPIRTRNAGRGSDRRHARRPPPSPHRPSNPRRTHQRRPRARAGGPRGSQGGTISAP